MRVRVDVAARCIHAEALIIALGETALVEADHIGPDAVDVGGVREVQDVGREASRRTHVDLEAHVIARLAQAGLVLGEAEELHVNETALEAERLGRRTAELLQRGVDGGTCEVAHVQLEPHDLLHRRRELLLVLEERIAVAVEDGVVAADVARDELLEDVRVIAQPVEERLELGRVGDGMRAARAHALLGLGEERIAHLLGEGAGRLGIGLAGNADLTRSGHVARSIERLHAGLALPDRDLFGAGARAHVEVVAQARVERQPVLVVRLDPVDLAVLEGEERDRTEHLVVVLEGRRPVVLGEDGLELLGDVVIRRIADTQHVDAVALQAVAPVPVGLGELR